MINEVYLGDSVYVGWDEQRQMIMLYTNNGFGPEHVIWLEPAVYNALTKWVEKLNNPNQVSPPP